MEEKITWEELKAKPREEQSKILRSMRKTPGNRKKLLAVLEEDLRQNGGGQTADADAKRDPRERAGKEERQMENWVTVETESGRLISYPEEMYEMMQRGEIKPGPPRELTQEELDDMIRSVREGSKAWLAGLRKYKEEAGQEGKEL